MTISEDRMNVTEFLIKFIQESHVLHLSVAKNRNSLSFIKPILLCPSMSQKAVFLPKKVYTVHCSGALLKPKTLFAIFLKRLQLT